MLFWEPIWGSTRASGRPLWALDVELDGGLEPSPLSPGHPAAAAWANALVTPLGSSSPPKGSSSGGMGDGGPRPPLVPLPRAQ